MTGSEALARRHEFVLFFDVTRGNPNGDPDAGNMPRMDPETGRGLVSDVCLKRKIRNYVELARADAPRFHIYVTEGAILNEKHREAYIREHPDDAEMRKARRLNPKSDDEALRLRNFMCDNFYDVRTFGAVMSTGINAGQVRGPVQITFAESIEPILPLEISITRMAATNEAEKKERTEGDDDHEKRGDKRTMGRKHIVPYALYRAHGYISAPLASHSVKGTGFSDEDVELLFDALANMFEHDHSAARGEMETRKLIIFRHASALGNARASELFERVSTCRVHQGSCHPPGAPETDNWPPARSFADYQIKIDRNGLPSGVEIIER
ncbi:MAG TPA: type I-C CRISPR-associated protein Cas7/Csd2 [Stellaceae bacterium]|jgi:CRISPR-associated protein Csd2|nr:type I-C CRISPR-associated protein Cas7/Csd2 [Stellaceae bacterium]